MPLSDRRRPSRSTQYHQDNSHLLKQPNVIIKNEEKTFLLPPDCHRRWRREGPPSARPLVSVECAFPLRKVLAPRSPPLGRITCAVGMRITGNRIADSSSSDLHHLGRNQTFDGISSFSPSLSTSPFHSTSLFPKPGCLGTSRSQGRHNVNTNVRIQGHTCTALLDDGATACFIDADFVLERGLRTVPVTPMLIMLGDDS
jgi:hypothetical protein